jgi:hypothetical protein
MKSRTLSATAMILLTPLVVNRGASMGYGDDSAPNSPLL